MKKTVSRSAVVLRHLLGPAAGAFGVWLLAEFPAVHATLCLRGF